MANQCDFCGNYQYDPEEDCYFCAASCMDEDDYARMMYGSRGGQRAGCPYYVSDDEYRIVRKQM